MVTFPFEGGDVIGSGVGQKVQKLDFLRKMKVTLILVHSRLTRQEDLRSLNPNIPALPWRGRSQLRKNASPRLRCQFWFLMKNMRRPLKGMSPSGARAGLTPGWNKERWNGAYQALRGEGPMAKGFRHLHRKWQICAFSSRTDQWGKAVYWNQN